MRPSMSKINQMRLQNSNETLNVKKKINKLMLKSDSVSSLSKLNGKVRPAKPTSGNGCYAPYKVRCVAVAYAIRSKEGRGQNVDTLPAQQGAYRSMEVEEKKLRATANSTLRYTSPFSASPEREGRSRIYTQSKNMPGRDKARTYFFALPFKRTTVDTAARSTLFA